MSNRYRWPPLFLLLLSVLLSVLSLSICLPASAEQFTAFSLRRAQALLATRTGEQELSQLGGITRIVGGIIDLKDQAVQDIILVGATSDSPGHSEKTISFEDLLVCLRSRLQLNDWPLVSVDNMPDSKTTHKQKVRFEGGINNTTIGDDMLKADLILKDLALGRRSAAIWHVHSYADLCEEAAANVENPENTNALFWFYPLSTSRPIEREGVYLIQDISIGTLTQLIGSKNDPANKTPLTDPVSEQFARELTGAYDDLASQFPELRRVKQIFSLVALAEGLRQSPAAQYLSNLVAKYPFKSVQTPERVDLLEAPPRAGKPGKFRLSGGIELRTLVKRMKRGDTKALREAVLKSRPNTDSLTWPIPIRHWQMADSPEVSGTPLKTETDELNRTFGPLGVTINRDFNHRALQQPFSWPVPSDNTLNSMTPRWPLSVLPAPPAPRSLPSSTAPPLLPSFSSNRIGGVMLSGTAFVAGADGNVDLSDGGFSFVVNGANASIAREDFSRFITALWAVYYSREAPGISIDPIDPSVKSHLVRYIGQVINSDLGRVMREADYHMKKVVMGIERPKIKGFQTPEDWMAKHRELYLAYRRFWFVPEDMRFREGDGMLLFDGGTMRLKTELMSGDKRGDSTPADRAFTDFYTKHYSEFASEYHIYAELFEYAKMVALARYLKTQGVPLHWFLLANRDLIMTEDSPSTVLELARQSTHFTGVQLKGGVDLGTPGTYVHDATARKAITSAMANRQKAEGHSKTDSQQPDPAHPSPDQALATNAPVAKQEEKREYTPVPQKSLTSGHDARGFRYQTDLAFRMKGEPALEMVRYFDGQKGNHGMFGNGWDMLLPYRITLSRERQTIEVGNQTLVGPSHATLVNLLGGVSEELKFNPAKYNRLGFVPAEESDSKTLGLFVTNAGAMNRADDESIPAYRLADRLGNEFNFDQRGLMTGMVLGREHRMTYTYARKDTQQIVRPGARLKPVEGSGTVQVGNFLLPGKLVLRDMYGNMGLVLVAQPDGTYLPETGADTSVKAGGFTSRGRFIMQDDQNNQVVFTADGAVESIDFSDRTNVVQSMHYERLERKGRETEAVIGQEINFEFFIDLTGAIRVGRAKVLCHAPEQKMVLNYHYDPSGWLTEVTREAEEK